MGTIYKGLHGMRRRKKTHAKEKYSSCWRGEGQFLRGQGSVLCWEVKLQLKVQGAEDPEH